MRHLLPFLTILISISFLNQITAQENAPPEVGQIAADYFAGLNTSDAENSKATVERTFTGKNAYDYFGFSVSSAGDVNGDGYSDVIVGAYGNDDGGSYAGKAYIYFGGITIDYVADLFLTGEVANDYFGYSVSAAGDVNSDGYGDVIVGAYRNDSGIITDAGKAYIYYGGATMDNAADVSMTGEAATDYFGRSVSTAGDVNSDGYDDVIISAYANDGGGTNAGKTYIYYGGFAMDNAVDVFMVGEAAYDYFGISVSSAGDVNGDGYDDVIIGANGNDDGGGGAGKVYIYYGGAIMDWTADLTMTGEAASDYFGYSVSSAGDVNGDGYSDVIIGSYGNDDGGSSAGKVYIYHGGTTMDNSVDISMIGEAVSDYFGYSVSNAGDVNGDGYADVIIGAINNDDSGANAGKAYIYYGDRAMDNTPDFAVTGEAAGDLLGNSVSVAGDFNGDGYADVIIGSHRNDNDIGFDAGRAYVFMHTLTGYVNHFDLELFGSGTYYYFGYSVACAGDVNGDGYSDIIIGEMGNDFVAESAGKAHIYFGGPLMDGQVDVELYGENTIDFFGRSVAGIGDVNGDGYDDVIVGAYLYNGGGDDKGRIYVFYGGNIMDSTPDLLITGEADNDFFGGCVAGAGDVNADGYNDFLVGAENNDHSDINAGKVYVYLGGSQPDTTVDHTFWGEINSDHFGSSISGGFDVNGDGYSDIIIGAKDNDEAGTNAGKAYLIFGGIDPYFQPLITFLGENTADYFGATVAGVEDMNGDGFDEIVISSVANDDAGTNAGKVYLYYGNTVIKNIPDMTFTGNIYDGLGSSISTAGDMNNDGFSDLIISGSGSYYGGDHTGVVYIYFGGIHADNIADITFSGEIRDRMGNSVSSAGDLNNDGYDDIIIGASANSLNGITSGKACIYISDAISVYPSVFSANDIPNDQGGSVQIKWARSAYDSDAIGTITEYIVQRADKPSVTAYWENLVTLPATRQLNYSYTAATAYDSTSKSPARFAYRVLARTSNPNEYWYSDIQTGYSVDNLSPDAAKMLTAEQYEDHSVRLQWDHNTTDSDLSHYAIHRSLTEDFTPDGSTLLATTTDTTYLDSDTDPIDKVDSYYKIITYDIHENPSVPSVQVGIFFDSSLPVFMSSFTAEIISSGAVELVFSTSSELNFLGFNIRRSNGEFGEYTLRDSYIDNEELRGRGNIASGSEYSWKDATVESEKTYYYQLEAVDIDGSRQFIGPISIEVKFLPVSYKLHQNYPNPFNPETYIGFDLPVTSNVEIKIYNSLGQVVHSFSEKNKAAGIYKHRFQAGNLSSGVYFYMIRAQGLIGEKKKQFSEVKKMVLLK